MPQCWIRYVFAIVSKRWVYTALLRCAYMSLSNLWVRVLVSVSGRFAGVRSEVLILTIGSGVLGGSHSRCACVASWLRTLG